MIHSTEGGSAESVAAMFHRADARASTHLVIDNRETYICVPDLVVPWGAPGVNSSGLHIEHCGFAAWSRGEWEKYPRMLDQSARRAAMWAWAYNIPTNLLTAGEVASGRSGFLTHATASRAFNTPGGHTDPGAGFPLDSYLVAVRRYVSRIEASRGDV